MDKNQYLAMFIDESNEHLQAMNQNLLKLEENPEDQSIISEVFRSAHTLKGMSATMGYDDLANLTHQMENVLDGIRNDVIKVTSDLIDVVFESVDHLEAMVEDISKGGDGKRNVEETVNKLRLIESGESPEDISDYTTDEYGEQTDGDTDALPAFDEFESTVLFQSKEQGFQTYFVKIKLSEDCILKAARVYMVFEVLEKAGEVIKSIPSVENLEEEKFEQDFSVVLVTKENAEDIEGMILKVSEVAMVDVIEIDENHLKNSEKETTDKKKKLPANKPISNKKKNETKETKETETNQQASAVNKTIRVNIDRLDSLLNLFEELVIDRGRLEQIASELDNNDLTETVEHMTRISGDLQNIILNMRMVPVEQVFNRFPRMVRGLAKDLNKKINLDIIGADTELDRTVIDEIGDPLVHLLRNSLDHGVEKRERRLEVGKPEEGNITLKAYHSGNHVFIEVEDDGAGIDRGKILSKAIDRGVVTEENGHSLTDRQVYELLFASGFSTADQISDVSGRGVGLDVVKNKIESLGGNVSVDSKLGKGTIFSIQLPLTLSIISVMLVEVQDEMYAIPLNSIIETAIIKEDEILRAHNQDVIDFRGKIVPMLDLTTFFDVPRTREQNKYYSVVIVRNGEKTAALLVDSFIGQQEIVLKALGNYLTSIFAISGATILGNGRVVLILDCNALIK